MKIQKATFAGVNAKTAGMTKLSKPGTIDALRKEIMDDPKSRKAYFEAKSSFRAARLVHDMRTHAGLTQAELAKRAGMSQPNVARIEQGDGTHGPSVDLLRRVAEACGFDLVMGYAPKVAAAAVRTRSKSAQSSYPLSPSNITAGKTQAARIFAKATSVTIESLDKKSVATKKAKGPTGKQFRFVEF